MPKSRRTTSWASSTTSSLCRSREISAPHFQSLTLSASLIMTKWSVWTSLCSRCVRQWPSFRRTGRPLTRIESGKSSNFALLVSSPALRSAKMRKNIGRHGPNPSTSSMRTWISLRSSQHRLAIPRLPGQAHPAPRKLVGWTVKPAEMLTLLLALRWDPLMRVKVVVHRGHWKTLRICSSQLSRWLLLPQLSRLLRTFASSAHLLTQVKYLAVALWVNAAVPSLQGVVSLAHRKASRLIRTKIIRSSRWMN